MALRRRDDGIRPEWLVPAAEKGESFAYALSKQTPTPPSAVKQGRVPGRGELPPPEGRMPPSADSIRSDVSYRTFQPTMGRKYCRTSLLSASTFSIDSFPAAVITRSKRTRSEEHSLNSSHSCASRMPSSA